MSANTAPATITPNEFTDRVKQAIDIGAFKTYLPDLKKSGAGYLACCPLHNDLNPSMSVEFKRGCWKWYCHPCIKGGDLFNLVREKFNLTFPEAVNRIAEDLNIQKTPYQKFVCDPVAAQKALEESVTATEGLAMRGISMETARAAGLGLIQHPGIGSALMIPYEDGDIPDDQGIVKIRALAPKSKADKFRHLNNKASAHLLFGIGQLKNNMGDVFEESSEVHITESELDSLMMRQAGYTTLSVSSATTCLSKEGGLKIIPEHIALLEKVDKIFLWFDMDDAGQKCAEAFEKALPSYKVHRVMWEYRGKDSGDPKDTGELYTKNPTEFRQTIRTLIELTVNRPPKWRTLFKSRSQMDQSPLKFLIDGFLPEGITFFGSPAGVGKTWTCLSIAKALNTGGKWLGHFNVPEKRNILYLVPEAGERSFRTRMEKMGIEGETFLVRTMTDGRMDLDDPNLFAAIRDLKPVVFLDTFIRFSKATDENDAGQMSKGTIDDCLKLVACGAIGVIGLHHTPKSSAGKTPTLENTLRGSTDIGASADCVYAIRSENKGMCEIELHNVKERDFQAPEPFRIIGRPHIDNIGDFLLAETPDKTDEQMVDEKVVGFIRANPQATYDLIEEGTGATRRRIVAIAKKTGWSKPRGKTWMKEGEIDGRTLDIFDLPKDATVQ